MTTSSGGEDGFHIDGEQTPSEVVLQCVAAEKGCEILDLAPLQDSIDIGALNQLFETPGVDLLRFTYEGFEVSVEPGRIFLTERQ